MVCLGTLFVYKGHYDPPPLFLFFKEEKRAWTELLLD